MADNPLWDRLKASMAAAKERHSLRAENPPPSVDFDRQLLLACARLLKEVSNEHNPKRPEEILSALETNKELQSRTGLNGVRSIYKLAFSDRTKLLDQRKQEDWADAWEKLRFLIFRTALTIIIALVVLGTGFLAKYWDIPLPMLRSLQ